MHYLRKRSHSGRWRAACYRATISVTLAVVKYSLHML